MPFRRRYARLRSTRRNKYNINTYTWEKISSNNWTLVANNIYYTYLDVVSSSNVGGTRKVKRFVLNMAVPANPDAIYWWALVYVPEGTSVSIPSLSGEGYTPSQYVLAQGMLTNQQPVRLNSPMARNLNQNDSIKLVIWHNFGGVATDVSYGGFVQYAICYN